MALGVGQAAAAGDQPGSRGRPRGAQRGDQPSPGGCNGHRQPGRGPSGGLLGGPGDTAVPMERASSSSGPALLATTPVNFPGMHAVRRSHDGGSLQGAVEAQQELEE